VEGFLLQGVNIRGRHQIISDYSESHKECMQESLGILEFVSKTKLNRDRDLEGFEGKVRGEVDSQNHVQEKGRQVIWLGFIKKLNG
jgi:hypothetical protein